MERYLTVEITRTYRIPDGMKDAEAMRVVRYHPDNGMQLVSDEETARHVWTGDTFKNV